ncbi:MAG: hypothetical protein LBB23_00415 [Rickettsiales bacterium]|nr:hypothetical protein [Rickettsiales bacterium]
MILIPPSVYADLCQTAYGTHFEECSGKPDGSFEKCNDLYKVGDPVPCGAAWAYPSVEEREACLADTPVYVFYEQRWCGFKKPASKKSNSIINGKNNALIMTIGVSALFVGLMWLIFRTPQSKWNPGQVRLLEF